MKAINTMIKECLKQNEKELTNDLLNLKSVKKLIEENKKFNFNISIFYNNKTNLLELTYIFKKDNQQFSVRFQMSELIFNLKCIEISANLIEYAINYFNNTNFKINIGNYDSDNYVEIKEYINSFYDNEINNEDKENNIISNLVIINDITDEEL